MTKKEEIVLLLNEVFRDKSRKLQLVKQLKNDKKSFNAFLSFSLLSNEPLAWRAAWLLRSCLTKNDERISAEAIRITKAIRGKADGHQRELIKNLELIQLEESFEGYLFDECMLIWETLSKKPSTRITAFKAMHRIAKKYPELAHDLELLTEEHYTETLTPGVAATLRILLKKKQINRSSQQS